MSREPLFELDPQMAQQVADDPVQPVLIHALNGFVDAGSATGIAVKHLLADLKFDTVATFETDELIDYRDRRPRMTFATDRFTDVDLPSLLVLRVEDEAGTPFLLLTGPEPDLKWDRFTKDMVKLAKDLNVRMCVGWHAIPWAAPHTRPVGLTPHASDRALIAGRPRWVGDLDVPGSASALLELRMGEAGIPAVGFTAHVPHYLTNTEFPPASVALVEATCTTADLVLPLTDLRASGADVLVEVDKQVNDSEETAAAVANLERQYDAAAAGRTEDGGPLLKPSLPDDEMASGENLAADFERYLREMGEGGRS